MASSRACNSPPIGFNWLGFRPRPRGFYRSCGNPNPPALSRAPAGGATVLLELPVRQAPWVTKDQAAEVSCVDLGGRDPLIGHVRSVERGSDGGWEHLRATIVIDDPPPELRDGMIVVVRIKVPVAALEPFRSLPSDPPPLAKGEPRQVYACPDHADTLASEPGRCPIDRNVRVARPLADHQRLRWWCPMHPNVTADHSGASCSECGGMALQPRVISYQPPNQVLAVPTSAVVDAGARKVVFVEGMAGMFDGVEVVLGPRCGDSYPVVRGIEAGQRVATAGAFLLDAETRLNPSLAAGYFGAGRGERPVAAAPRTASTKHERSRFGRALGRRSPVAERQKLCPVTNKPLGSMGTPARVVVSGRVVFLCCDGCEDSLKKEPAKYLARVPASK